MTGLLVSVRTVEEADAALRGGADLIDIKEPAHGPLGKADDARIEQIAAHVAGRRPVSAALGELKEATSTSTFARADNPAHGSLTFLKWGLSGLRDLDWQSMLLQRASTTTASPVFVAYADHQQCAAPSVDEVCEFACSQARQARQASHFSRDDCLTAQSGQPGRGGRRAGADDGAVLLVDTFFKEGVNGCRPTLLDWLNLAHVSELAGRCRDAGVRLALAGRLGWNQIEALLPIAPTWIAVRSLVCAGEDRLSSIDRAAVHRLKSRLLTGKDVAT